ncbi:MAG: porphobilinogen synthase [Candidatus Omnitrophica bacterium]|nr:porphobilinogen synthase [Candidatus Omnitrophota bacterium]
MIFENSRLARLRQSSNIRDLVRETRLHKSDLIMPLFFKEGKGTQSVPALPGVAKMSREVLLREAEALQKLGIKAVLLFGSASAKDAVGSSSYAADGPFQQTIRAIKKASDIVLITDVCLCAYTTHGHCGIVAHSGAKNRTPFRLDSGRTLAALAKIAVSHAQAGADIVAPSAMADGQVAAIRQALDKAGLDTTAILSYAVKYASSFYGPFRDIYDSSPAQGDRRGYQMDPANGREALAEAALDVAQGADMVMVKPALAYLDIIQAVRAAVYVPVAAYNVSGEYAMVKAAHAQGWLDEKSAAWEILNSIKRAGADLIITYWAKEAAQWI